MTFSFNKIAKPISRKILLIGQILNFPLCAYTTLLWFYFSNVEKKLLIHQLGCFTTWHVLKENKNPLEWNFLTTIKLIINGSQACGFFASKKEIFSLITISNDSFYLVKYSDSIWFLHTHIDTVVSLHWIWQHGFLKLTNAGVPRFTYRKEKKSLADMKL